MPLSKKKKEWTGRILLILLAFGLFGLMELGLRLFGFGNNYEFILTNRSDHPGRACLNLQYVALHYFRHLPVTLDPLLKEDPWFPDTEFSPEKKDDTFRIFLVGASTTRGFPFEGRKINYSGFLKLILKDVLPDKKIEVVNAGYDALSSFGVLDLTRQVLQLQPDMLVVYTGHNEFIGHFGVNSSVNYGDNRWPVDMVTRLHQSRLFLMGELMAMKVSSSQKAAPSRQSEVNLFRAMLSEKQITWDSESHAIAMNHFKENLSHLTRLAKEKGTQVVLINPASNLRDFEPIQSGVSGGLSPASANELEQMLSLGEEELNSGHYQRAIELFNKASRVSPEHAGLHFFLGRAYEALGDYARARREYQLARGFDRVHLRACGEIQEIVRQVLNKSQVAMLELEQEFEEISPNGLIGANLFLEHVHPNVNGHLVIADALARLIEKQKVSGLPDQWKWDRLRKASEYVRQTGYDGKQFHQSRYTVGRLLLDFPFYQCDAGRKQLEAIKRDQQEQELIRACYVTRNREVVRVAEK